MKEIDFQKTSIRWNMNKRLRKNLRKLPYFLLHNYPAKLKVYNRTSKENKKKPKNERAKLNGYKSPSPLNELCEYVESWEKKNLLWQNECYDTRYLIVDNSLSLDDPALVRRVRREINNFIKDYKAVLDKLRGNEDEKELRELQIQEVFDKYKECMAQIIPDEELLANYVISVSYARMNTSKLMAWAMYGDTIIKNLRANTPITKKTVIIEVPYKSVSSKEFLGKNYEMIEVCNERSEI